MSTSIMNYFNGLIAHSSELRSSLMVCEDYRLNWIWPKIVEWHRRPGWSGSLRIVFIQRLSIKVPDTERSPQCCDTRSTSTPSIMP